VLGIDFRPGLQVGDAGLGIGGKVRHHSFCIVPAGLAAAPLVGTEHDNAFSREMIRENEKRFVAHDALVAIMWPASSHEDHSREWAFAFRDGQGGRKVDVGICVPVGDLQLLIRVRPRRILRALSIERGTVLDALEGKRPAVSDRMGKKIKLLAGSEVDILVDGRLDYEDAVLKELDFVVASPHVSLKQDADIPENP